MNLNQNNKKNMVSYKKGYFGHFGHTDSREESWWLVIVPSDLFCGDDSLILMKSGRIWGLYNVYEATTIAWWQLFSILYVTLILFFIITFEK